MRAIEQSTDVEALLPAEADAAGARLAKWPIEVRALIAYLAKPRGRGTNKRRRPRKPLRIEASLWFDGRGAAPVSAATIYTRDTSGPVLGILTQTPANLGQRVQLEWADPSGVNRRLDFRVMRCRPCREGWFEGALVLEGCDPNGSVAQRAGLWRQLRTLLGG